MHGRAGRRPVRRRDGPARRGVRHHQERAGSILSTALVRRATAADRDISVAAAVAAFANEPILRFFFLTEQEYAAYAPRFFGVLFDQRVDDGEVWVSADGAATAMWDPPGGLRSSKQSQVAAWLDHHAGLTEEQRVRFEVFGGHVDVRHPKELDHWYLGVLATDPTRWRTGLGRALQHAVLDMADRDGLPAYLETATSENAAYYARSGWAVREEVAVPGGPHVWCMWRDPVTEQRVTGDRVAAG